MKKNSAETPQVDRGVMYHIGLKKGDVAPYILMCGDPGRVEKVARLFDSSKKPVRHREYVTVTGKYKGIPVSVMATGMGCDNTEIAVVELSQIVDNPAFIRIGTSGAYSKRVKNGDLVITTGSVRLENTSTYFVCDGYPAIANYEIVLALLSAAERTGTAYHLGITSTAPGFYGAQGRDTPFFHPRFKDIPDQLAKMNVLNNEMEASTLFTLATLAGFRAGMVCAIIAERHKNRFISKKGLATVEDHCIRTGLEAFVTLAKMDKKKKNGSYWLPRMGI